MVSTFEKKTDVLVLGSGPAGFAAAIAVKESIPLDAVSSTEIRKIVGI